MESEKAAEGDKEVEEDSKMESDGNKNILMLYSDGDKRGMLDDRVPSWLTKGFQRYRDRVSTKRQEYMDRISRLAL